MRSGTLDIRLAGKRVYRVSGRECHDPVTSWDADISYKRWLAGLDATLRGMIEARMEGYTYDEIGMMAGVSRMTANRRIKALMADYKKYFFIPIRKNKNQHQNIH